MLHVRHAVAALIAGQCTTVLITHGRRSIWYWERRLRSRISLTSRTIRGSFWSYGSPNVSPFPVLRYMKNYGMTHEQLAMVAVVREWASKNPRASFKI